MGRRERRSKKENIKLSLAMNKVLARLHVDRKGRHVFWGGWRGEWGITFQAQRGHRSPEHLSVTFVHLCLSGSDLEPRDTYEVWGYPVDSESHRKD